ncbi:MAG: cell division protein FtsX [Campylobacterota bacterium]|nr:cell division protein FtsX [Campylobacterota bacterium]
MKSVKNHFSLIIALLSILFSLQIFIIVDRSIDAYKENLANNYSVIAVSQKSISKEDLLSFDILISDVEKLEPDGVIKRLDKSMDSKNIELLKITLPKFYKLHLNKFPTPKEVKRLTKNLLADNGITKVEDFSHNHDNTYKMLLLFKNVISIFAITILVVTTLLIFKELKIWQYQHSERMSIMGLFGAPVWLRSAILFRLAITDAVIATIIVFGLFSYLSQDSYILEKLSDIGVNVVIYDQINDSLMLLSVAMLLSLFLASMIVLGHKEEV